MSYDTEGKFLRLPGPDRSAAGRGPVHGCIGGGEIHLCRGAGGPPAVYIREQRAAGTFSGRNSIEPGRGGTGPGILPFGGDDQGLHQQHRRIHPAAWVPPGGHPLRPGRTAGSDALGGDHRNHHAGSGGAPHLGGSLPAGETFPGVRPRPGLFCWGYPPPYVL